MTAACGGNIEILKTLLAAGASINARETKSVSGFFKMHHARCSFYLCVYVCVCVCVCAFVPNLYFYLHTVYL